MPLRLRTAGFARSMVGLCLLASAGLTACYSTEFVTAPDGSVADGVLQADGSPAADGTAAGSDQVADGATDAAGADAEVSTACPGAASCPCATDNDCTAGVCLLTSAGKTCAVFCSEGQCASGAVCGAVDVSLTTGPTRKFGVCLPKWPTDCMPCTKDGQCAHPADKAAGCVDPTGGNGAAGRFCSDSCATDSDCPAQHTCQPRSNAAGDTAKYCVATSGTCSCSGLALASQATTTCAKTAPGKGVCKGQRACLAQGLSDCSAADPVAEACNGLDDDCDGSVDEPSDATALCDDGNLCTDDSCAGIGGCVHLPNTATCSDDDACSYPDQCDSAKCVGVPLGCDDLNVCTSDACDSASGCVHVPLTAPCEDGSQCTLDDACADGSCKSGALLACNDGNPCTNDWCDSQKGCVFLANDATCDDGNACTGVDTCAKGKCQGPALVCDDGWGCTDDVCDGAVGCTFNVKDAGCGKASVPYKIAFACADPLFSGWDVTAPGISVANPKPTPVAWKVDDSPAIASTPQCGLNVNNGTDLACGFGQYALSLNADSPWLDATAVPAAGALLIRFESAGTWPAGHTAQVLVRTESGAFTELAKLQPSGALWGKVVLDLSKYAGKVLQIRLSYNAADCAVAVGSGWFVRNLEVVADPCASANGGCATTATCSVGPGATAVCTCSPGYQGNGVTCTDIDECKSGAATCASGATCTNQPGTYSCGCLPGFQGDGKNCVDVDECANGAAACSPDATCKNTIGSYACSCKTGFSGNGKTCTDIDECATGKAGCSGLATCTNTPGSFLCTCPAGYAGDGKTCTDVDECAVNLAGCATDATCTNSPGSYTCACKTGWLGNGKTCLMYGSQDAPAPNCKAIKALNATAPSDNYWLAIDGQLVQVPCDMVTDGGGWTVIQYKADLPLSKWSSAFGWVWLTSSFQTVLTAAQIKALQAQSSEGRQLYVGLCNRMVHYKYTGTQGYERAFGFRFLDGTETTFGQQVYTPYDITVPQDGCQGWASEGGLLSKSTQFLVKTTKVPIINVRTSYNQYSSAKFGSPLTQNPAMLR